MDNSRKEKLEELINTLAELRARVDALEKQVEEYRLEYGNSQDDEEIEVIEIPHEDFLEDIIDIQEDPAVEQEAAPEPEPEAESAPEPEVGRAPEPEAFDEPGPDEDSYSLFGEFIEPKTTSKPSRQRILNDANSTRATGAVIDRSSLRLAWMTDIPGPEVKDVRSAISLNDRVMFIGTLFREDSMLFQDVVSHINSMTSLDKAVNYLQETFPEWDMESDPVYRFMMAVRRKIR